jgi:hypothetical protein
VRPDPANWRRIYAEERARLGEGGLAKIVDDAPRITLPAGGAIIFPHTFLSVTGRMVAAAARAVIDSGVDRVVAIGVLHGGRRDAADEFSLDGFLALLELAARRANRREPDIAVRFPTLADPAELREWRDGGAAIVATADPIHYGIGYDQPDSTLAHDDPRTVAHARTLVTSQFTALARGDIDAFRDQCAAVRSDFRDAGALLATVIGSATVHIHDLLCVDYSATLASDAPTWVAGALATFTPSF